MTIQRPRARVRHGGVDREAAVFLSTEALAAADDAAAAYVREHYPEFAAAGGIGSGAYRPISDDSEVA